jgi:hypothetical protein
MEILQRIFGKDFLRYVFAQDDVEIAEASLSRGQNTVVRKLMDLALDVQAQPPSARQLSLVNAILSYADDEQTTVANAWRRQCGGDLISPHTTKDPVLRSLLILVQDTYPAFMLPREKGDLATSEIAISRPVFRHPEWKVACRAVLDDKALGKFFPADCATGSRDDTEVLLEVNSVLTFSSGTSQKFQLTLMPNTFLASAYLRYLLPGGVRTLEKFASCMKKIIAEARHLAEKRSVNIPLIYGISNVEVPSGTCMEIPWGTLRSPESIDQAFVPEAVEVGAVFQTTGLMSVLEIGESREDDRQATSTPRNRHQKELDRWAQQTDRKCDLFRLAILLASPDENFIVANQASRTILDPLQRTPTMRWTAIGLGAHGMGTTSLARLEHESLSSIQHWAKMTDSHPHNLDIAMRRTLSSVAERIDPLDGFIDAVLAWENLFSARPETSLRVCGAIAWLLESESYERRTQLHNELSKLYASRSGLVHGSTAGIDNAATARDRAVRISIECMRRLYAYPELLNAKDSSVRGKMLLMGCNALQEMEHEGDPSQSPEPSPGSVN